MKIDRYLQKEILLKLSETYPHPNGHELFISDNREYKGWLGHDYKTVIANIFYLQEHQLVTGLTIKYAIGGSSIELVAPIRLTHKGLDFLLDDGGLSAILGTVTVKFHEDTIKALLSTKIEQSSLPEKEKSTLLSSIKNLSGKALEHAITKMVDLSFENADQAIPLLRTILASLQ
ncbi:hypothetical protein [Lonepinella koalarum]|uniref:hypothetical protein n=1 Tax=Lonepinella koalarum TaxID=53417 RepID=UPI003F6DC6B1